MRKTSAYARKTRLRNNTYNGAEWLNTITRCRQYSTEKIPGAIVEETSFEAAQKAMIRVRMGLDALVSGDADEEAWDLMAHATGISKVRSAQVAGPKNVAMEILDAADAVLSKIRTRYEKWGKWQVLDSEYQDLVAALDVYEAFLTNSSPAQMGEAMRLREKILEKQKAMRAN